MAVQSVVEKANSAPLPAIFHMKSVAHHYLVVLRPANLVMILIGQSLTLYTVNPIGPLSAKIVAYGPIILGTLLVAGAGYLINDHFDRISDQINANGALVIDQFSETSEVYRYYLVLNALAILCGFFSAQSLNNLLLGFVLPCVALILFAYSRVKWLKLGVGAVLISICVSATILLIPWMESVRRDTNLNQALPHLTWLGYNTIAFAAFWLNLMRELIKDLQDIKGDQNDNRPTLPIIMGTSRAKNLVIGLGLVASVILIYGFFSIYTLSYSLGIYMITLLTALLYFCHRTRNAHRAQDFKSLSLHLKYIMLQGTLALLWLNHL